MTIEAAVKPLWPLVPASESGVRRTTLRQHRGRGHPPPLPRQPRLQPVGDTRQVWKLLRRQKRFAAGADRVLAGADELGGSDYAAAAVVAEDDDADAGANGGDGDTDAARGRRRRPETRRPSDSPAACQSNSSTADEPRAPTSPSLQVSHGERRRLLVWSEFRRFRPPSLRRRSTPQWRRFQRSVDCHLSIYQSSGSVKAPNSLPPRFLRR
jgi:hypothetical protein